MDVSASSIRYCRKSRTIAVLEADIMLSQLKPLSDCTADYLHLRDTKSRAC